MTNMRIYEKGLPTDGWARGEKITRILDVQPGDYLICVNHQFGTENLCRVLSYANEPRRRNPDGSPPIFYYTWAYPDGTMNHEHIVKLDNGEVIGICCWDFQLELGTREFFRATKEVPGVCLPLQRSDADLPLFSH